MLASQFIPQASDPERIIALARHLAAPDLQPVPDSFRAGRDVAYYRRALQILGWLDERGLPTPLLRRLPDSHAGARRLFIASLDACALGVLWREHHGIDSIQEADPSKIEDMLTGVAGMSAATLTRRASTLRSWLRWCRGEQARPRGQATVQMGLFDVPPPGDDRLPWPDRTRFPHNEDKGTVAGVVEQDLAAHGDVLVVVGYASLDRVIHLLARQPANGEGTLRILFGNEPFASRRDRTHIQSDRLADEARDYWLERGISVLRAADVLAACDALKRLAIEVRIAPNHRGIHAKIYGSDRGVTLGSSNYTSNGMSRQSEANVRFQPDDVRFSEAMALAEGLWEEGVPYLPDLLVLLESLLRKVTWQEALARACAEVLEGDWARRYVPPDELDALATPMWPHQMQGISQAVWILHNRGSVLVADATGSGKTRMGAWLLRAAYDRQVRGGQGRRVQPVMVAPPPIVKSWTEALQECGLRWRVDSHGPLSNAASEAHASLIQAVSETELLGVDEAHNFLNSSNRTNSLRSHYADNAILFTATPINRSASDLLALVELLGPDNFDDAALEILQKLMRIGRSGRMHGDGADRDAIRDAIRDQIQQFMVRRTRRELNRIVDGAPLAYQLRSGRTARYPHHEAQYFDVPATERDLDLAAEIVDLADQLHGVARLGSVLTLPRVLAIDGMNEEDYLRRVVRSVAALARHFVLDCLRSSRVALYEHIHGTEAAVEKLAPDIGEGAKSPTGNTIDTLSRLGGKPPVWQLDEALKAEAPRWTWDPDAHSEACEEDAAIYQEISNRVVQLSELREQAKVSHLHALLERCGLVIAYDGHVLTLKVFEAALRKMKLPVHLFSGEGGAAAKRKAMRQLGLNSDSERLVALCTDAFSEGMNLQKASVVVHLDTPTVIRTAEQRAGRVDRMDSPYDQVEIWWPRDPASFAPRKKELLRERHEMVSDLIGANLQMPGQDGSEILAVEELASKADIEREEDTCPLYDAFRPVRVLVAEGGVVGPTAYDVMRTSQAEIVSCVSLVPSETAWGFFAVGGLDRVAPRWILLDGPADAVETDLGRIARWLTDHLGPGVEDHPLDDHAQRTIAAFVDRLRRSERDLLPVRRRRALALADKVVLDWQKTATLSGDMSRVRVLERIRSMLGAAPDDDAFPDPRSVADAWLRVVRPVQIRLRSERRRRHKLWKLDDLYKPLLEAPVETSTLERAFAKIPMLPPISERVVAMIVGVPVVRQTQGRD